MLINSMAFGAKTQFWRTTVRIELNIYYLLHINCSSSLTNGNHSKAVLLPCCGTFLPNTVEHFFVLLWILGEKDCPGIAFRGRPGVGLLVQNTETLASTGLLVPVGLWAWDSACSLRWEDAAMAFSQLLAPGGSAATENSLPFFLSRLYLRLYKSISKQPRIKYTKFDNRNTVVNLYLENKLKWCSHTLCCFWNTLVKIFFSSPYKIAVESQGHGTNAFHT